MRPFVLLPPSSRDRPHGTVLNHGGSISVLQSGRLVVVGSSARDSGDRERFRERSDGEGFPRAGSVECRVVVLWLGNAWNRIYRTAVLITVYVYVPVLTHRAWRYTQIF